jgi:hypothetical protein
MAILCRFVLAFAALAFLGTPVRARAVEGSDPTVPTASTFTSVEFEGRTINITTKVRSAYDLETRSTIEPRQNNNCGASSFYGITAPWAPIPECQTMANYMFSRSDYFPSVTPIELLMTVGDCAFEILGYNGCAPNIGFQDVGDLITSAIAKFGVRETILINQRIPKRRHLLIRVL